MQQKEFKELVSESRKRQDTLLQTKGHDYTRASKDRLHNFKAVAADTGLTPMQVWSVYFLKHIYAILTYIKTGHAESESINSRFDDAVNYLYLGEALLREERDCNTPTAKADNKVTPGVIVEIDKTGNPIPLHDVTRHLKDTNVEYPKFPWTT